jgi:hypothetical protein
VPSWNAEDMKRLFRTTTKGLCLWSRELWQDRSRRDGHREPQTVLRACGPENPIPEADVLIQMNYQYVPVPCPPCRCPRLTTCDRHGHGHGRLHPVVCAHIPFHMHNCNDIPPLHDVVLLEVWWKRRALLYLYVVLASRPKPGQARGKHGWPWGFSRQPAPIPMRTHTCARQARPKPSLGPHLWPGLRYWKPSGVRVQFSSVQFSSVQFSSVQFSLETHFPKS